jgi:ATP-dependent DNA helicase RecG
MEKTESVKRHPWRESQHIEFKQVWTDDHLKWIAAFANADGGVLHLGRDDRGDVVGLSKAKKLLEDLPNKIRDVLGILVAVNFRQEQGKDWIEVVVDPYPYPVSCRGAYHVRSGSTCQELKGAALDRFLLRKVGRTWDGIPVPHVKSNDLDSKAIAHFRALAKRSQRVAPDLLELDDEPLLEKLHLREGGFLKRATVLLFHPDPEVLVTGAFVKIGFFRTNSDLLYHDEIHGDLITQAQRTIDLVQTKYFRAHIAYEGMQRVETWPVPDAALREAVYNAILHKDYATGIPIQISVYDDKLMIWNPGVLPEHWSLETLLGKYSSKPFNPDLANAFFRAGRIEAWGRGIEKIQESCRAQGLPTPELRVEGENFWTTFRYPSPLAHPANSGGTTHETTHETTQERAQDRILSVMRSHPTVTRIQLAQHLGITADGVKYHLDALKKAGRIRHVGPTKAGTWEILR